MAFSAKHGILGVTNKYFKKSSEMTSNYISYEKTEKNILFLFTISGNHGNNTYSVSMATE